MSRDFVPSSQRATPLCSALVAVLAIGCSGAFAYSTVFCPNDTFPLDASMVRARPVPYRTFESLSPAQFPRASESVRFDVVATSDGKATVESFHRRGGNVGFASRLQARRTVDERSGLRVLTLTREDDACMSVGVIARSSPADAFCARLEAVELMRGAWTLDFRHPLVNHQLQFTMIQARTPGNRWALVPSRRPGEPERLDLEFDGNGDRLLARWTVVDISDRERFDAALVVDTPASDLVETGFDDFELGLLGSLDFLDELSDLHRDWVVYAEQVDTMEPVPEPGDDFYGCEPSDGVCSAEYDTCIATEGGWLGCNFDPTEPGWGGGLHGDGDGDGDGNGNGNGDPDEPPDLLPDWQPGSMLTSPRFPAPLFHGMHVDYDSNGTALNFGFSYDITSVLQKKSTVPKPYLYAPNPIASHVLGYFLTRDGSDQFVCGLVRLNPTNSATIQVGNSRTYRSPDGLCERETILRCSLESGIYVLHYNLDPTQQWDEGSSGEANNAGLFRGLHIED